MDNALSTLFFFFIIYETQVDILCIRWCIGISYSRKIQFKTRADEDRCRRFLNGKRLCFCYINIPILGARSRLKRHPIKIGCVFPEVYFVSQLFKVSCDLLTAIFIFAFPKHVMSQPFFCMEMG